MQRDTTMKTFDSPLGLVVVLLSVLLSLAAACPSGCRCGLPGVEPAVGSQGSAGVECAGLGVTAVPGDLPTGTIELRLTRTGLRTLEARSFSRLGASLRRLVIDDNKELTSMHMSAFQDLSNLEELLMTGNRVEFAQIGTFVPLSNLRVLDLSGNVWKVALATMFSGLIKLLRLNLSNNRINDMGDGSFSTTLPALQELDLAYNNLSVLQTGVFSSWDSLQTVNLTGNFLATAPVSQLEGLKGLRTLDLSSNPLRSLSAYTFRRLAALEDLRLNVMDRLSSLRPGAFMGLSRLRHLEFRANPGVGAFTLSHLPSKEAPSLEYVDLSNNTFTTLEEGLFMDRSSLRQLLLEKNPFHCDCALSWMGRARDNGTRWPWAAAWVGNAITSNNLTDISNVTDVSNVNITAGPMCASPSNLEETYVADMVESDFTCTRAEFFNVSSLNETTVNITDTAILQAFIYPGLPTTLWLHPRGWHLRGEKNSTRTYIQTQNYTAVEEVQDNRHVKATLTIDKVSAGDLGIYTLVATNAAGNSSQQFRLQLEDGRIGTTARPVSSAVNQQGILSLTVYISLSVYLLLIHN